MISDSERLPSWWRVVLNFVVPFFAEMLLCVFLSYFLTTEQEELLLQTTKHTTRFCNTLPEITVQSKPVHHSKSINFSVHELETCSEYPQSHRQDSCPVFASLQSPVFSPPASEEDDGCVKTHRNGVSIYTVNSLLDSDDLVDFPPPPSKEGVKSKFNKCKSMSCLSDLASASSRQARTLQVFDNDLFFRDYTNET